MSTNVTNTNITCTSWELPPDTVVEDASSAPQPEDYVFVDGLRLVKPYYFDFKCFVKKRQDGKPLMQLMAEEFPMLSAEYYSQAVATGRLRVEASSSFPNLGAPGSQGRKGSGRVGAAAAAGATGATAAGGGGGRGWDPERPLRAGMCIRHFIHRHEPPVLAGDVQILGITDDFVAVNKPACLPVHTVGQYRKNTVMGVVQAMRPDLWPLYPTYRLDKPVSGVLLLARSSASAARMRVLLEERGCAKAYVARVQGRFPDTEAAGDGGPLVVDVPLGWEAKTNHATPVPPGAVAGQPAVPGGPPLTAELIASAKPAETHFRRLSVSPDGLTSVVEAVPKTGRTHQIRVHLQYLGHPIANDTQYGGSYGLPLFFRRGMAGPARPHVNGLRRRVAAEERNPDSGSARPPGCHVLAAEAVAAQGVGVGVAGGTAAGTAAIAPEEAAATSASGRHAIAATDTAAGSQQYGADENDHEGPAAAEAPGLAAGDSAAKRQRRCCADAGGGNDPGRAGAAATQGRPPPTTTRSTAPAGTSSPSCTGDCTATCEGTPASQHPMGDPHGDAELVAAASERYLQLYTRPEFQVPDVSADPLCPHCPCLVPEGYPIDLEPLYLHAARYAAERPGRAAATAASTEEDAGGEGPRPSHREAEETGLRGPTGTCAVVGGGAEGWSFAAPLPEWALPEFVAVPASGRGRTAAAG